MATDSPTRAAGIDAARHRKRIRLAQTFFAGVALGTLAIWSLPPRSYPKDLQTEYLQARALIDGVDLLTPIGELVERYSLGSAGAISHPSPHLPVLALLGLPFAPLPFSVAVPVWLVLNLVLLLSVGRSLGFSVRGSLALAAWPPLFWTLWIGQWELVVLALLLMGWRAARAGRDWQAGAWLGLAAALKAYPALLCLPYLARRRFRVVAMAAFVFALANLASLMLVGMEGMRRYYLEVVPTVTGIWSVYGLNSAPHGALLRLFGGAADVEPLISLPWIVWPVTIGLSAIGLLALLRLEPEEAPAGLFVALPASWGYHATLLLPQVVALLRRLGPRTAVVLAVGAASVTLVVTDMVVRPTLIATHWQGTRAPSWAGLPNALQAIGYIALLALSLRSKLTAQARRSPGGSTSGPGHA